MGSGVRGARKNLLAPLLWRGGGWVYLRSGQGTEGKEQSCVTRWLRKRLKGLRVEEVKEVERIKREKEFFLFCKPYQSNK